MAHQAALPLPCCLVFTLRTFIPQDFITLGKSVDNICNIGNKMIIATLRKMVAVKVTTCQTLCNLLKMTRQEAGKTTVYKGCQTLYRCLTLM